MTYTYRSPPKKVSQRLSEEKDRNQEFLKAGWWWAPSPGINGVKLFPYKWPKINGFHWGYLTPNNDKRGLFRGVLAFYPIQ